MTKLDNRELIKILHENVIAKHYALSLVSRWEISIKTLLQQLNLLRTKFLMSNKNCPKYIVKTGGSIIIYIIQRLRDKRTLSINYDCPQ